MYVCMHVCSKIILMRTESKHHIVCILNIHSMFSQSNGRLGMKTL